MLVTDAPNDDEGIAEVFVALAVPSMDTTMYDFYRIIVYMYEL